MGAHWPALLAWFLAGALGNHLLIQLAALVGAFWATGGALLLPLAVLARLVSYVAMFLVVRDGMPRSQALHPLPTTPAERRSEFVGAVLGSVLPFVAFYTAWGLMYQDNQIYVSRILQLVSAATLQQAVDGTSGAIGDGRMGGVGLNVPTVAVIVAAFVLRWLGKRWAGRLPKAAVLGAVYLEVLWVYLSATVISDVVSTASTWVSTRQGMLWLDAAHAWAVERVAFVGWLWDGMGWLLGEAGGVILLPLAWLAIAGVVYGQAVAPEPVAVHHRLVDSARSRWALLPGRVRSRLADLGRDFVSRFRPIGRAFVLMWRAGPVLIGGYVLLFTLLLALSSVLGIALSRVIGPHDLGLFWTANALIITLVPMIVIEPLRIGLVAGAYDEVIGRLVRRDGAARARRETDDDGPTDDAAAQPVGARLRRRGRGRI